MPALPVSLYSRAFLCVRCSCACGKICKVVLIGRGRWAVNTGFAVVFFRFFIFSQPVVAHAELNTGEIAIAIFGDERPACFIFRNLQRKRIPEDGGLVVSQAHPQRAELAADFRARGVIAERACERLERSGKVARIPIAIGKDFACLNVVLDPPFAFRKERFKLLLCAAVFFVVIELAAIIKKIARAERLSVCALRFIDAQVPVGIPGFGGAVRHGGGGIERMPAMPERFVDAPAPEGLHAPADEARAVK